MQCKLHGFFDVNIKIFDASIDLPQADGTNEEGGSSPNHQNYLRGMRCLHSVNTKLLAWNVPLNADIESVDPLSAQIQIRLNLLQGMNEFSLKLLEVKNGEIQDNFYKIIRNESCVLSGNNYECVVLKSFREKENRETLYYLIPDLDYMFLKIIDTGPERNQKLELLDILSLG